MSEEDNELFLSDDALLALVSTLATEVVRYGEAESTLLEHKRLSDEDVIIVMKANTLLTVFAMFLVKVVESKDIDMAKTVVEAWISPAIQDMVQIAFAEEIDDAADVVTQGISNLEDIANKETGDTPNEQGD
jgi:hypothetical protein